MSALPPVRNRHNVCVICEGYEFQSTDTVLDIVLPFI